MFENKLPSQINYSQILPKGFPTVFKQWHLDPMTNNTQIANNDIVRFLFLNNSNGVLDPYKSYIQITVNCNTSTTPVGLLQVDNSAQSFIQQIVFYSNNKQIERLNNYSVLAAYLNDIGLNQLISEGRETQGLGYGSFDTMPFSRSNGSSQFSSRPLYDSQTGVLSGASSIIGPSTCFPTIGNYWGDLGNNVNNSSMVAASRTVKGHTQSTNLVWFESDINGGSGTQNASTGYSASLSMLGYPLNVRAQYQTKYVQNNYLDTPSSVPNYQIALSPSVSQNSGNPMSFKPMNPVPYQVQPRGTLIGSIQNDSNTEVVNNTFAINSANFGFNSLFTPFFTRGTFQPIISPTVPQCQISNGFFLSSKIPITQRRFKIPLISSVMGVLIDPSQFKLIPLQSLSTLLLEITLDPYAMFTSGYCDMSEFDNVGIGLQQNRNYQITKIVYKLQTYNFVDEDIQKYIQSSLVKQISIITNFWTMSNQYQIPGGAGPNNSYIVGCNATHLNQIVCLFVLNDYQDYSFCRKHWRISNNVSQFWSKLAVDYWPPQPWKGNAGNVCSNNPDDDNSSFVENIYWSNNYMFSKAPLPRINAYNFALNDRPYNVLNSDTMYQQQMTNNIQYIWGANSVNADTAMGMAWIHQNRCVGKAAYVLSYTPFQQSQHVLQGINVQGLSNFEVIFQCTGQNVQPRDQTLYIFSRSSGIVKYGARQIKTFGRG